MPAYAQIDMTGEVVGVTQTAEPVIAAHMIPLDVFDAAKLGQVYEDGDFRAPE